MHMKPNLRSHSTKMDMNHSVKSHDKIGFMNALYQAGRRMVTRILACSFPTNACLVPAVNLNRGMHR